MWMECWWCIPLYDQLQARILCFIYVFCISTAIAEDAGELPPSFTTEVSYHDKKDIYKYKQEKLFVSTPSFKNI